MSSDASDDMPSSTLLPGPGSLPCSALLNGDGGCDDAIDAIASGLRPDNGLIDYALGHLFGNQGGSDSPDVRDGNGDPESKPSTDDRTRNQGAAGSRYVANANGYPVSQPSTDDQTPGRTRNVAGGNAPQPFGAPQFTQWPMAPGTDPLPTGSILEDPNGDQDPNGDPNQTGPIDLGVDLGSLPPDNGPITTDELLCPPPCHDDPVATIGSPAAVAEPATLSLLGLGILAFAGLRRRAQRARSANNAARP